MMHVLALISKVLELSYKNTTSFYMDFCKQVITLCSLFYLIGVLNRFFVYWLFFIFLTIIIIIKNFNDINSKL